MGSVLLCSTSPAQIGPSDSVSKEISHTTRLEAIAIGNKEHIRKGRKERHTKPPSALFHSASFGPFSIRTLPSVLEAPLRAPGHFRHAGRPTELADQIVQGIWWPQQGAVQRRVKASKERYQRKDGST